MSLSLALDIVLIVLLLATIVYAMVLHRRLGMLRSEKEDLEGFLDRMNKATAKADASLKGIRQTAEQVQAMMADPMARAQAMRDELMFLIERADSSAERVAGAASAKTKAGAGGEAQPTPQQPARSQPRRQGAAAPAQPAPAAEERGSGDDARSQAERDLMNALRNVR